EVIELTQPSQTVTFSGLRARPVPSILRGFSAPVVLTHDLSDADRAHLLAYDTDPFNRWEAGNILARKSLLAMILDDAAPDAAYLTGIKAAMTDSALDPASRAFMAATPTPAQLAAALHDQGHAADPDAIYSAKERLAQAKAESMADVAHEIYAAHQVTQAYRPDAEQTGKRTLANVMLRFISRLDGGETAAAQYANADNMTQQLAALSALLTAEQGDAPLQAFETQWRADRLVMDKWFGLQVSHAKPDDAVATARRLTEHPDFNHKNPNRFRAVLGALAGNHAGFHHASGAGYAMLADWLITLDPINPQTTARMCAAFQTWKRYDADRQALMLAQVDRILATPDLSRDATEMLSRIRAA
ncbi:MAG: DUF3458 domain-containing protein, partial [Pseudomonadota bacterium]